MDKQTDKQMDKQMDKRMDEQKDKQTDEGTNQWTDEEFHKIIITSKFLFDILVAMSCERDDVVRV